MAINRNGYCASVEIVLHDSHTAFASLLEQTFFRVVRMSAHHEIRRNGGRPPCFTPFIERGELSLGPD